LQIWNPDGTEAEKSGNGLRIFARYLWDQKCVADEPFTVATAGGTVQCRVAEQGRTVTVDMGAVSFDSRRIPVQGPPREALRETLVLGGRAFEYSAATIGNPHCVVLRDHALADEARMLGPLIETDPRFPNRTNVQFVEIVDRHRIAIEIWERGAGYTLASGSSSCAAAAVVVRLGLCDSPLSVQMPGGTLAIAIDERFHARMTGPVCKVAHGRVCREVLEGTTVEPAGTSFTLIPFESRHAESVLKWVLGREEAAAWAGLPEVPLDPAIFARWHVDPEIHASILLRDGTPVGYGEIWENFETDAVELARLIVDPSARGRGIGRILIDRLCAAAAATGSNTAFLRVRPDNTQAIRCYQWAAFRRISSEQERRYNLGQPIEYVWMSREIARPD
jgi:diaminopimelate epimerase